MNRRIRAAVLLAASLAMTACTTLQPVSNGPGSLHAGDQIEVQTTSGKHIELEVSAADATSVSGTTPDKANVRVPLSDIAHIDRKDFDGAKTVGLLLIVGAVLVGIGAAIGKSAGTSIATPH